MKATLRPYQEAHRGHVERFLSCGKSCLMSLFTGAGKTVTALASVEPRASRTLWLADTRELVRQNAREALVQGIPVCRDTWAMLSRWATRHEGDDVDLEQALEKHDAGSGMECRTYAWMATQHRLGKVLAGRWDLIVCDEADLAGATKWSAAIQEVGAPLLGLTATPFRHDKRPLDKLFGDLVRLSPGELAEVGLNGEEQPRCLTVRDGIELGWLVDAVPWRITFRDFDEPGPFVDTSQHREHVWRRWGVLGRERITIVVLATIEQADAFAQTGNEMFGEGTAAAVHMRSQETISDWKAGRFQVACTVAMAYRGIDHPSASALVFCVDTESLARQFQFLGRGLRLSEGKEDCLLLVASDAYRDLQFDLFDGIQGPIEEEPTLTEVACGLRDEPDAERHQLPTLSEICSQLERLRLWRRRVASVRTMAWTTVDGCYALCLRAPGENTLDRAIDPKRGEWLIVRVSSWDVTQCIAQHCWSGRDGHPEVRMVATGDEPSTFATAEKYAAQKTSLIEVEKLRRGVRRWVGDQGKPTAGVVYDLLHHWLTASRWPGGIGKYASQLTSLWVGDCTASEVDQDILTKAREESPVPRTMGEAVKIHRRLIASGRIHR